MNNLTYLQGYPEQLLSQVRTLINEQRLGDVLAKRYPGTHDYATDKALWQYTQDLKNQFLRNAPPINKVMYDNKIHVLKKRARVTYRCFSCAGRQAESKSRDPRRYCVSQRAGTVFTHDRGARTGAPEGERA
jgi:Predicted metal-dependent hydrolase